MNNAPMSFNKKTDNALDYCEVSILDRAYLTEQGFQFEALECIKFLDNDEDRPWFNRRHEFLGYVFSITECGRPVDPEATKRTALEAFGQCDVLWI